MADSGSLTKIDVELSGFAEQFVRTLKDASRAKFGARLVQGFKENLDKAMADYRKAAEEVKSYERQLQAKNLAEEEKQRLRDAKETADAQATLYKRAMVAAEKAVQKEVGKVEAGRKKLGIDDKGMAGAASAFTEKFADGIHEAFRDITSKDIGSMVGVVKKLGAAMTAAGEAKAGTGGVMGGLGTALKSIGPLIAGIGALVGALAVFVKMVVDADAKAKELNRTLLDAGVTGGELADEFGAMGDSIDRIRKTFTQALSFNNIWGTTAADHLKILGAYANAGRTFREITANVANYREEIERLRDATSSALAYSKLFGQDSSQMAENMATWMEELGGDFKTVTEGLSAIHMAARDSGFGVKRFYGMVLQATSGMSMYNVRLSEAAGLLVRLGKILGVKGGAEFLQGLTKGFGDKSIGERRKQVMTTGEGKMQGIYQRTAMATATDFLSKLNEFRDKDVAGGAIFAKALERAGFKGGTGQDLVKALQTLNPDQMKDVLAEARRSGNDDLVRQMTNLMRAATGAKGGHENLVMGAGGLDMGGKLAAMLGQMSAIEGTPLYKMNSLQLQAFEQVAGISGEQLEQLRRVDEAMHGNWDQMKKLATAEPAGGYSEAEQRAMAKTYGAVVDKGTIKSARILENGELFIGDKMRDIGDYIQGQGETLAKAAKEGVPADIMLAQDIVSNTTEMTKILEQGVEYWLEEIYSSVEGVLNWMTGGSEKKEKREALDKLGAKSKEEREKIRASEREIAKLRGEMATETPEGRAKIQAKIDTIQRGIDRSKEAMRKTQEARGVLTRTSTGWFGSRKESDFLRQAYSQAEGGEPGAMGISTAGAAAGGEATKQKLLQKFFGTTNKAEFEQRLAGMSSMEQYKLFRSLVGPAGSATPFTQTGISTGSHEERLKDLWTVVEDLGRRAGSEVTTRKGAGEMGLTPNMLLSSGKQYRTGTSTYGLKEPGMGALEQALGEADLDTIVKADDARQVEADRAQKKMEEDLLLKKQPPKLMVAFKDALKAQSEEDMAADLRATLATAGVTVNKQQALSMVRALEKDATSLPEEVQKVLDVEVPIPLGGGAKAPLRHILNSQGFPVPVVTGGTPGPRGRVEEGEGGGGGGGGGGGTGAGSNNFLTNIYDAAAGALKVVRKVQKATPKRK